MDTGASALVVRGLQQINRDRFVWRGMLGNLHPWSVALRLKHPITDPRRILAPAAFGC